MCKSYLHLLFISILFFTSLGNALYGNHVASGDMSYEYLGSNKYLIKAKIIRDCAGVSLDAFSLLLEARDASGTYYGQFKMPNFKRISIAEVSPRCSNDPYLCKPQNSAYTGNGWEEHVFIDTVDLTKHPYSSAIADNACVFTFYMNACCRTQSYTTGLAGADLFSFTTINFCNLSKCKENSSSGIRWSGISALQAPCNGGMRYYSGGNDPDNSDIVRFKLRPALAGIGTNVTYTSPFTYQYPLTPYCVPPTSITCTPNTGTNPPRGFFMDTNSAMLIFTPTKCDEVSDVCMEATEWRRDTSGNLVWIGKSLRDMMVVVRDDYGYSRSPVISVKTTPYNICAGDSVSIPLKLSDAIFAPYQTAPDTLLFSYDTALFPLATMQLTLDTAPNMKEYLLTIRTSAADAGRMNQRLLLRSSDNFCKRPMVTHALLTFNILPHADSARFTKANSICGDLSLKSQLYPVDAQATVLFRILDSTNKLVRQAFGTNVIVSNLPTAKYKIEMVVTSNKYCYKSVTDSIQFTYKGRAIHIGKDTTVCVGERIDLKAELKNFIAPVKYHWEIIPSGGNVLLDTAAVVVIPNVKYNYMVLMSATDSTGCGANATMKRIFIKPQPTPFLGKDTTSCYTNSVDISDTKNTVGSYLWNTADTTKFISVTKSGSYSLQVTATNGCKASDTIVVNYIPKPNFSLNPLNEFCPDNAPIDLNDQLFLDGQPVPANTTAYVVQNLNGQSNPTLNVHFFRREKTVAHGVWNIVYAYPVQHCPVFKDTIQIQLYASPKASYNTDPSTPGTDEFDILFQNTSTIPTASNLSFQWNMNRFPGDYLYFKQDSLITFPGTSASYATSLKVTSEEGCMDSTEKTLSLTSNISEFHKTKPWVTGDLVLMNAAFTDIQIHLYDGLGRLVTMLDNNMGLRNNRIANLSSGCYFYMVEYQSNGKKYPVIKGKIVVP